LSLAISAAQYLTFPRLAHDVQTGMQRDGCLDKTPLMVGVRDFPQRAFAEYNGSENRQVLLNISFSWISAPSG